MPRLWRPTWADTAPLAPPPGLDIDIDLEALASLPSVHWLRLDLADDEAGWTTQPAISHTARPGR